MIAVRLYGSKLPSAFATNFSDVELRIDNARTGREMDCRNALRRNARKEKGIFRMLNLETVPLHRHIAAVHQLQTAIEPLRLTWHCLCGNNRTRLLRPLLPQQPYSSGSSNQTGSCANKRRDGFEGIPHRRQAYFLALSVSIGSER